MSKPGPDHLELLSLGGVGRIGMNNMLLSCGGDTLLLDCGVAFPGPTEPGIDLVLPALDVLADHAGDLRGIVLTHGHEDHIGAVPFVLARHRVPVYGTRFTLALVHEKLVEHGLAGRADLREVAPGDRVKIGCFEVGFLRVTHSLPDCVSLRIETPVGRMLFTGDFKIDPGLADGTRVDEDGFRALGDEGVLLMMSDSTNAEVEGHTRSEAEVAKALRRQIAACRGRVLVGLFASNLYRVRSVIEAARSAGRYAALIGRSLGRYHQVASRTTRLGIRPSDLIEARDIDLYDDDELVLLCTGSQGEVRSALRRIASGRHHLVRLRQGDTLLMSARRIPGNERTIYDMLDDFTRQGVEVIHPGMDPRLHASGHACKEELRALLSWVKPRFLVPVHGTHAFMRHHADLAGEAGVECTLVIENGQRLRVDGQGLRVVGELECTPWLADGSVQASAKELDLRGRLELMREGVVAVAVRRGEDGRGEVRVRCRGLAAGEKVERDLVEDLRGWMASLGPGAEQDWFAEELRRRARRYFKRTLGKRPVALINVI